MYTLWHGDCLEEMSRIEAGSIDAIIADLPYGTTACKWDIVIPFEPLWKQYKRVIKRNGAIVLFGSQPFTTLLIASSPYFGIGKQWFKYEIIWQKTHATGGLNAKFMPLKNHENILVFYESLGTYNPQMFNFVSSRHKIGESSDWANVSFNRNGSQPNSGIKDKSEYLYTAEKYPLSVVFCMNRNINGFIGSVPLPVDHPTQKPVALMEYLIKTYTNEGDTVLDSTCGSGSTLEAAMRCERHSIGIEKDAHYFSVAQQRLARVAAELRGELNHLPMFAEAA